MDLRDYWSVWRVLGHFSMLICCRNRLSILSEWFVSAKHEYKLWPIIRSQLFFIASGKVVILIRCGRTAARWKAVDLYFATHIEIHPES